MIVKVVCPQICSSWADNKSRLIRQVTFLRGDSEVHPVGSRDQVESSAHTGHRVCCRLSIYPFFSFLKTENNNFLIAAEMSSHLFNQTKQKRYNEESKNHPKFHSAHISVVNTLLHIHLDFHDTEIAHFESYGKGFLLCMLFDNFISLNYMS